MPCSDRRIPQAVLFDNDGTLVDTRELILLSMRFATRKVLGRTVPDDLLLAGVGRPLASQMRDFTDDDDTVDELLRVYRAHNREHHDRMVKVFSGVPALLEALSSAGAVLGVVTSKMHPLAQRGLEICGVMRYFDFLVGADDWPEHKPAPGPVAHGCALAGADPSRCVYVGDSVYDIEAGNAAGTRTAAVLWGIGVAGELASAHPTYVCETVSDLARTLGCEG